MRLRLRKTQPIANPDRRLLDELIDAPAAPVAGRLRPIALRSVARQRSETLAPYPLRTWLDRLLTVAERGLVIGMVVFWTAWLGNGWGQELLYDWTADARPITGQSPEAPAKVATMATQARVAAQAPGLVDAEAPHPELGASLPVVDERWERPAQSTDYLVPARAYVPARVASAAAPAEPAAPAASTATDRDLRPTRLVAPSIALDSRVVEVFVVDGAWQVADYAVGYHHGTGVPGAGNVVMAGHKGLRGAVFSRLEELRSGDELWVEADGERFFYRVSTVGRVWPNQVDVMYPTERPILTLITCTNWDLQRFIVVADLIDSQPAGETGAT